LKLSEEDGAYGGSSSSDSGKKKTYRILRIVPPAAFALQIVVSSVLNSISVKLLFSARLKL
jgi:hypothetical protein